jgi:hypothetical protein
MRLFLIVMAVAAVAATAAGCGGSGGETTTSTAAGPTLLFVLDVPEATARPTDDGYELSLAGVDKQITWFSDHPDRIAGSMPAEALLARWDEFGFTDDPPNATLTIHPVGGAPRAVPVTLSEPTDDLADGVLVLRMKPLPLADGETPAAIPADLGPTSIFLDSVVGYSNSTDNTNLSQQNAVANQQAMNEGGMGICPAPPPCY